MVVSKDSDIYYSMTVSQLKLFFAHAPPERRILKYSYIVKDEKLHVSEFQLWMYIN